MLKVFVITNRSLDELKLKDIKGNEMSLKNWEQMSVHIDNVFRLSDLLNPSSYKDFFDKLRECNCFLLDLEDFFDKECQKGDTSCCLNKSIQSAIALGIGLSKKDAIYGCIAIGERDDPLRHMWCPEEAISKNILPISTVERLKEFFYIATIKILEDEKKDALERAKAIQEERRLKL